MRVPNLPVPHPPERTPQVFFNSSWLYIPSRWSHNNRPFTLTTEATHSSPGFLGFTASSFMFFVKPRLNAAWKKKRSRAKPAVPRGREWVTTELASEDSRHNCILLLIQTSLFPTLLMSKGPFILHCKDQESELCLTHSGHLAKCMTVWTHSISNRSSILWAFLKTSVLYSSVFLAKIIPRVLNKADGVSIWYHSLLKDI